jgi:hypothetical protein
MTLVLNTTKQIGFDDLITGRLERYGITIVMGCGSEPIVYLCSAGAALRACLDDKGFCYFVVPDNGALPWAIFDAIVHEFDCGVQRMVDGRGRVVTSFGQQAVIDFLGSDHLEQGDLILSCLDDNSSEVRAGSALCEQAAIARGLVEQNPRLHEDPQMLLLLVEDLYGQRHPPFKVTLQKESVAVAQLLADAMLSWAEDGQYEHQAAGEKSARDIWSLGKCVSTSDGA